MANVSYKLNVLRKFAILSFIPFDLSHEDIKRLTEASVCGVCNKPNLRRGSSHDDGSTMNIGLRPAGGARVGYTPANTISVCHVCYLARKQ
jgi:hypothetical protein